MNPSRKTILSVIAVIGVILTSIKEQFGLTIDVTSITAGLGAVLVYILLEAKLDLKALAAQPGKWKDPKFWITFLSALLAAVNTNFGLGIPVEAIIGILTVVVGILFKAKFAKPQPY